MAYHRTSSGLIQLLHSWGHGRGGDGSSFDRRPATIVFDDGDGHYTAWKVAGKMRDAAEELAHLHFLKGNSNSKVAVYSKGTVTVEAAPENFWIGLNPDADGEFAEFEPNLAEYPGVVGY